MKIRFLLAILLCQFLIIPPPSASSAVFTFTSPDLPASIQGEASVLNSSDLGDKPNSLTKVGLAKGFGRLPLSFEVNQGQTNAEVKFLSRGKGYTLFLTPNEAVLSLKRSQKSDTALQSLKSLASLRKSKTHEFLSTNPQSATEVQKLAVLRIKLIGSNPQPELVGLEELPGKVNYFIGNDPKNWQTRISTFAKVKYKDVYPGIDLVYYGNQGQLEYDFIVAPGADPKGIKFKIQGADKFELNGRGDLVLKIDSGGILQNKPLVHQEVNGNQKTISSHYVLKGKHEVGFEVAMYDVSKPLVIDPVLSYSTYLGGSDFDAGLGIAVDSVRASYVAGFTESLDFPTRHPVQPSFGAGNRDAFVAKLTPDGSALVYATYIGGSNFDEARGIAVDSDGAAYVTGVTLSANFPTVHPLQPTGIADAFVVKLTPDGSGLVYSTYLGGRTDVEEGNAIAVDADGAAYVAGRTDSVDFPTMHPLQSTLAGATDPSATDAFVAKLTPNGSALVYATYLGGSGGDEAFGIAIDAAGAAYVTGQTASPDFPTVHAVQPTAGGPSTDAFMAKLTPDGSALVYATYLGGSDFDRGQSVAVDDDGSAYLTGVTSSRDFPTMNALQPQLGRLDVFTINAFVVKLIPDGSALAYATYLGGSVGELGSGIAVDVSGAAYVAGITFSSNFPTVNALQPKLSEKSPPPNGGNADAFVAKLAPDGSTIVYATYLGGSDREEGLGIAVDTAGAAYVTGLTQSSDSSLVHPVQSTFGGGMDAFVAKLIPSRIVNDLVTFVPIESTFYNTPSTSGCPSDFVGEFSFSARLTHKDVRPGLSNVIVNVITLTNGNLVQNADSGPGGVGNTVTVPRTGDFSDGLLRPGQSVDVPFRICLKSQDPFTFLVDVHVPE
jgi:hypothetical protein